MSTEFTATAATFEDDGYVTVLSFADNGQQSTEYLILQVVNAPSAEDVCLGHDRVHIEFGGQGNSGYGLVRAIVMTANVVEISLSEAATTLGLSNKYLVHLAVPEQLRGRIAAAVEKFSECI